MHEVNIAHGLLDMAIDICQKEGHKGIEAIKIKVGKASGVMPHALSFAFESVKVGTIAEKAVLTIEEIPVSGSCLKCGEKFSVDDQYIISCPKCGGFELEMNTGRELNIDEMEVF